MIRKQTNLEANMLHLEPYYGEIRDRLTNLTMSGSHGRTVGDIMAWYKALGVDLSTVRWNGEYFTVTVD
jgi:hypothetical protein